ncbi:hypothetical protein HUG10_19820 (plasmid) [Halorarum halophilum]|uniref:Uncharacterized protein n=1 Tax=Halorarum halophilum TaxID=2743090 RepID=A0A7D5KW50_9EURY|nr:hypothetical protein [Halobaculum halophilum]QLG29860.1 hypothetical protein HUG10_19820 [Halobaculum halophilum]
MADMTVLDRDPSSSRDHAAVERAQMFLIGGLALALVLVALVLVLNSAIYTENLATRGSGGAGVDATLQVRADVQQGMSDIVEQSNRDHAAYMDQLTAIQAGIPALESLFMRYDASDGRWIRLQYVAGSDEPGMRIHQDTVADFQADADGDSIDDPTWTLVEQTPAVRNFQVTITNRTALVGTETDAFRIVFDQDATTTGDEWTLLLYNDSGATVVAVDGPEGSLGECHDTTGTGTTVDVTAATVDGERCPALEFLEDIPADFDLRYEHGGNATGTYEVTGKEGESTSRPSSPYLTGNPVANDSVYGVTVHLYTRSSDITYETDVRVAPGEQDA